MFPFLFFCEMFDVIVVFELSGGHTTYLCGSLPDTTRGHCCELCRPEIFLAVMNLSFVYLAAT